jgi:ABC-type transport system involved in cytochrome bd biosynthesis fused ATPase/permease subunit
MSIVNEIPYISGNIDVKGSVFYVSQQPWLYPASIKDNILFGKKFDKKKFQEVIKFCFLNHVNKFF